MDDIFRDNIGLFELFILSVQNCFLFYFSKYIVPLQFYTPRCLYNLHSGITDLSINMLDPFLSPHPWISLTARMEKRSPRQAPLSSACSDLRSQPLALPNVGKHKICTGLQSNSVLAFPLKVKPSCYLLSVFIQKQQ